MVKIEQVKKASPDIFDAISRLVMQLGKNYKPLSKKDVQEMLSSPNCFIFFARSSKNNIVGMATLIVYGIPYIKKAILEDVVVDEKFRGQGIGTKLIKTAIAKAKKTGAFFITLASRPDRKLANRLYKKLGFKQKETNIYLLEL